MICLQECVSARCGSAVERIHRGQARDKRQTTQRCTRGACLFRRARRKRVSKPRDAVASQCARRVECKCAHLGGKRAVWTDAFSKRSVLCCCLDVVGCRGRVRSLHSPRFDSPTLELPMSSSLRFDGYGALLLSTLMMSRRWKGMSK